MARTGQKLAALGAGAALLAGGAGALLGRGRADANHANGTLSADGIGYPQVQQLGYISVYNHTASAPGAAGDAIAAWQQAGQAAVRVDLVRQTNDPSQSQVEVMDAGAASVFGPWYTNECANAFPPVNGGPSPWYAVTLTLDAAGVQRGQLLSTGFLNADPGYPFAHSTLCLNPARPNDKGTIAHELGHALGLDHVNWGPFKDGSHGACSYNGYASIMSYNYSFPDWQTMWPPNRQPTTQDVVGPWVCNAAYAGGLAYIYQFPAPTPTPTPAPAGGGGGGSPPGKLF